MSRPHLKGTIKTKKTHSIGGLFGIWNKKATANPLKDLRAEAKINHRSQKNFNHHPHQHSASFSEQKNWRFNLMILIAFLIVGLIIWRLFFIGFINHEQYQLKASKQHQYFEKLKAKRGDIFFKDGPDGQVLAATNEERDTVIISPKYIIDEEGTIQTLATILNLDTNFIREKMADKNGVYKIIMKKITPQQTIQIKEKKMPGVTLIPESWRIYPENSLAAQVLGFVSARDENRLGQYGVEGYFNDLLEGESGFIKAEKDTVGRWISINNRIVENPKEGADIVLTIDRPIQFFVEKTLADAVDRYAADRGTAIVMDPNTGKILAMATVPNFNANEYNKVEDSSVYKNLAITDQYEPGSAFKPITTSIPFDLGKLNPESTYNDTGAFKIAGFTIRNSDLKSHGVINITRFLELSLNTGAIFCMQAAGKDNFLTYVKNYGFGRLTGIELVGEVSGDINNLEAKRDVNFVTAAFGQGISVTPLQLVTAFSAVINDGKLMKPQIIESISFGDGKKEIVEPKMVRQVITADTSKKLRAMLVSVVKNGWSKPAGIPGYLIGGKTGTAQVAGKDGGYEEDSFHHTFVGFAPADNPQFVTLVKLENVKNTNFADASTGPTTARINKFLFDYFGITPTEEIKPEEQAYYNRTLAQDKAYFEKQKELAKEAEKTAQSLSDEENNAKIKDGQKWLINQ